VSDVSTNKETGVTGRLTREDLARIRDTIRSNLFDGDESGVVTMRIRDLLDKSVEAIDIEMNGEAAFTYIDDEASQALP
jgi:hypothetical protein